jgi:S1-C subfamily serine protease
MKRSLVLASIATALISLPVAAKTIIISYSTGTGFFISRDGYVLTNNHVVPRCQHISVHGAHGQMPAKLIARDIKHDLALLKASSAPVANGYISSQKQPLQKGDMVVILGYPGDSWKSGRPVMSKGQIINTKGPRGEERWVEFSDVLQKGNSGGPLLDATGNVVGVVAAKARAYTYNVTEGRTESVRHFDLAISLPVIRTFLKKSGVQYHEADSGLYQNARYTAQQAERFVVNVRCKAGQRVAKR